MMGASHTEKGASLEYTSKLTIQYTPIKGRYLTATQDIPPNTVLFSELAYASVSNYSSYCSGCFIKQDKFFTFRPYYCEICSRERSESELFTDLEMKRLKSFSILCFRIVNKLIREDGFDFNKFSDVVEGKPSGRSYYKDDYVSIAAMTKSELLVEDKDINLVIKVLEKFNENYKSDHNLSPEKLRKVVQHVFSILQYNVQGVRIVVMDTTEGLSEIKIGVGLYPTLALLNHSCNNNTRIRFEKSSVVIISTKFIKCGAEVTHNYGPTVEQMERERRIAALQQMYDFTCDCESCIDEGAEGPHAMSCQTPNCTSPISFSYPNCMVCGTKSNPVNLVKLEQELIDQLTMIEFDRDEHLITALIDKSESVLYHESMFLGNIYNTIAKQYCENSMWAKADVFSSKSCDIIKAVYGPNSLTYGFELFKLCQIQYNKIRAGRQCGVKQFEDRVNECCALFDEPFGAGSVVLGEMTEMLVWIENSKKL